MKELKIKNVLIFACTVSLLFLADIFSYIVANMKIKIDINNLGMWVVQVFIYIFLVMTTIYLLTCLGTIINNGKNNQKFWLIFTIIINLIFLWDTPDFGFISKEFIASIVG